MSDFTSFTLWSKTGKQLKKFKIMLSTRLESAPPDIVRWQEKEFVKWIGTDYVEAAILELET